MSGIFTVQFNEVAVTAAQDLFEIVAPAAKPLVLLGYGLSQKTEKGDAEEELLTILFKSGQTTSGSGGSAPTPVNQDTSGAAASFTAEANNTTKASAGTIVTHLPDSWNVRQSMRVILAEPEQIMIAAGRRFTMELLNAPTDSITMNGYLLVQEIG
jgi:hypothetical protein